MKLAALLLLSIGLFRHQEPKPPLVYFCPMHVDVTAETPGTCATCGMTLVKGDPFETLEYIVRTTTEPRAPKVGERSRMRFEVFHPATRAHVEKFEIVHDQPYHLFVISHDLSHFFHVHPQQQPDGSFSIDLTLPQPGYYRVYSDFLPTGGTPQVIAQSLVTAAFSGDLTSSLARLSPDTSFTRAADDLTVALDLDPPQLVGGGEAVLTYRLTDRSSGQPVIDLQPYLGAWGHSLILSEDLVDYVHAHPTDRIADGAPRASLRGGPDVMFRAFLPRPGRYRIWTQFKRHDRVTTVSFTVQVGRSGDAAAPALTARGASPAAFGRRCIPPGGACRRPAPGFGKVSPEPWRRRIAPRSHMANMLARLALPAWRIAALNATLDLHHGLLR